MSVTQNANLGLITLTSSTTVTPQAGIQIHNGQTLMAVYTIPAGYTGFVTGASFSAGEGKQVFFRGKFRNGPDSTYAFSVRRAARASS